MGGGSLRLKQSISVSSSSVVNCFDRGSLRVWTVPALALGADVGRGVARARGGGGGGGNERSVACGTGGTVVTFFTVSGALGRVRVGAGFWSTSVVEDGALFGVGRGTAADRIALGLCPPLSCKSC